MDFRSRDNYTTVFSLTQINTGLKYVVVIKGSMAWGTQVTCFVIPLPYQTFWVWPRLNLRLCDLREEKSRVIKLALELSFEFCISSVTINETSYCCWVASTISQNGHESNKRPQYLCRRVGLTLLTNNPCPGIAKMELRLEIGHQILI